MRTLVDDEDDAPAGSSTKQGGAVQQPAWMRVLLTNSTNWLESMPKVSLALRRPTYCY